MGNNTQRVDGCTRYDEEFAYYQLRCTEAELVDGYKRGIPGRYCDDGTPALIVKFIENLY